MGGIRLQTSLPPPDRGRCLPELPAASRASRLLPPEPSTSRASDLLQTLRPPPNPSTSPNPSTASRHFDCLQTSMPPDLQTSSLPDLHAFRTCTPSRPLDLCGSMPTRPPEV